MGVGLNIGWAVSTCRTESQNWKMLLGEQVKSFSRGKRKICHKRESLSKGPFGDIKNEKC